MKRTKVPDYKEKSVFGVPLIVHVQRCGFPLPLCLQQALSHLRTYCLDQVSKQLLQDWLYVPKEQRLQAVRAAILLMPDENREVLQTLLYFLRDVTSLVEENQMTPMNLAVCLGPSLFHLSILKNETLSPRCA
ncbi:hypothetical protein XENOCAPTIV_024837 [Xenoophorus captivus]|uniref:Rho-GAP domain-containing protein n=1 Tax=Xenoophorus captivus TaxID=1517983 RepID=A0ABV0R514_9TELE